MAKKLWGGRFSKKTDPLVEEFTRSIDYDYKLAKYDVMGSLIHVTILEKAGFLLPEEALKLSVALYSIVSEIDRGDFRIADKDSEDIHSYIQHIVEKQAGDLALKLHTARSRNDQVVLAAKLYVKMETIQLAVNVVELKSAMMILANANSHIIIPGVTHLQHAQPVWLTAYLFAYMDMLTRDEERLLAITKNLKMTMGAGALAGTPIDAEEYKIQLSNLIEEEGMRDGFIEPSSNALDTVSDRDFVIEVLSALSILGMHLSRLAEDFIIWSTKEFDFIEIDEAFCTGSSLMPQKKNPDVLELIRGYAGRLYGNLVSVLTMMKGLPLTYNRDMQLDKEPLFNSIEIVSKELKVLTGLVKTVKFNEDNIKKQLEDESLYATDLVYYLVIQKKIAFKDAHTIIGKLFKYAIDNNVKIKDMPQDQIDNFSDKLIKSEIIGLFDPQKSVLSKKSIKKESQEEMLSKLSGINSQKSKDK